MKWFLGAIDFNKGQVEIPKISDLILKQFNNKVKTNTSSFNEAVFSIAENSDKAPEIFKYNDLILVGEIRIDNREELNDVYSLNYEERHMKDEIILLYLFDRVGEKFFAKLVGEFAFVILNKCNKEIYLVRDQIGIKTLFWMKRDTTLWIFSDLFLIENIVDSQNLNKEYFSEFYHANGSIDSEITPFTDVYRIPSAHFLNIREEEIGLKKYWDLVEMQDSIYYKNISEYEDQFLDIIKKSVECRLIKGGINAVMMSGGLDSTSIFAIAKLFERENPNTRIKAVCGVFNKYIQCDERQYIRPVVEMYGETPSYEICDDYGVLKNFPNDSPWTYEPNVNSATYIFTKSIAQRACNEGAINILSGYAGDHVLGGSLGIFPDMMRRLKINDMIWGIYHFSKDTRQSFLANLLNVGILPLLKKGWAKDLTKGYGEKFLEEISMIKSFNQKEFYKQLYGTKTRLFSDRLIGPEVGIEFQHPFLDKRLVEFLFRIPGEMRLKNGVNKFILRNTMSKYLPNEVVERVNKTAHLPLTYHGLKESWSILYPILKETRIEKLEYINREDWDKELIKWRQGVDIRDDFWILLTMEIWLYHYNNFK